LKALLSDEKPEGVLLFFVVIIQKLNAFENKLVKQTFCQLKTILIFPINLNSFERKKSIFNLFYILPFSSPVCSRACDMVYLFKSRSSFMTIRTIGANSEDPVLKEITFIFRTIRATPKRMK